MDLFRAADINNVKKDVVIISLLFNFVERFFAFLFIAANKVNSS